MQVKIFTLPIHGSEQMEEANRFLRSHRVMTVDRQFSPDGGGYWTLFVTYQDGQPSVGGNQGMGVSSSGKVDYRRRLTACSYAHLSGHYRQRAINGCKSAK